jgi:hypothetical protein
MQADPLADLAGAIRAHPKFDEAALRYIEHLHTWRSDLGALNKIISSHARGQIIACVMYLHFNNETGNSDNGATFERVADLCLGRVPCGPKVLRTVLVVASLSGYLEIERGHTDRRLKLYRPTEKLLGHFRKLFGHKLACFDHLVEGRGFARKLHFDPRFVERLIATSGNAYFALGAQVGEKFPDLYPILCIDGGFGATISVVESQLRGRPAPSLNHIGQRFRVSPSQARKILKLAEERGLILFTADGRVADASGLVGLYKLYLAREFALYAKHSLGLESSFITSKAA